MILPLASALAGEPVTVPCALDGLPDAALRWDPTGRVELLAPDGALVTRVDTGMASKGPPKVTCAGTRVSIVLPSEHANATFSLNQVRMDLGEHVTSFVRWDPIELACAEARRALGAGQVVAAAAALAKAPPADPRVARAWLAIGRAANGTLEQAEVAVAALAAPGWTPAEVGAIRLAHARALTAGGRAGDAIAAWRVVLAADPRSGEAAVAIGDLLWDAGDRAGAREAYLVATPLVPTLPERVADRCPACRKKGRK
ncbi:MAG: tetratricopeptide repeat protein [Myxococcota bacterium]